MKHERLKKLLVLAAVCAMGSCVSASAEVSEEYKTIVDDYASVMMAQDGDSALLDKAFSIAGEYMENPEEYTQERVLEEIEALLTQMENNQQECTLYEMDDAFRELLRDYDIEPEEYAYNANSRIEFLEGYLNTAEALLGYLEFDLSLPDDMEMIETFLIMGEADQLLERAYNYCGVNYWFAGCNEEEQEYIKTEVLDKFQSFALEEAEWLDSREDVEKRLEDLMDIFEQVNLANHEMSLGESKEQLRRLEVEIDKLMKAIEQE